MFVFELEKIRVVSDKNFDKNNQQPCNAQSDGKTLIATL